MDQRAVAILSTLIAYKVALLGLGLFAQRRTRSETDFFLGGRQLGPLVAAISASASSSSAWTLLGVSGYAYANGLSAVWLFPSCVGGFALNWYLVAPRLRRLSAETGALTVTELLAGPRGTPLRGPIIALASGCLLFSLMIYVAYQFMGAGESFEEVFGLDRSTSILVGSAVIITYTLLGGFWAVSLTDTLQGLLMAATAMILPIIALVAVGGPSGLLDGLAATDPSFRSLTAGLGGASALGMVAGLLGIGLGYPGQPHVVNRFMALRDDAAVGQARRISLAWAVIVYAGMILLGLCARLLFEGVDQDRVFVIAADGLCHPVVAGVMLAAMLSAIMSTADSQLLVAGSAVSHDLGAATGASALARSRLVVLALSIAATAFAIVTDKSIFSGVLFAWSAMGAAFGPLLVLRLWRGPVPPLATLLTILVGFSLSVLANAVFDLGAAKGFAERVVPIAAAFAVALGVGAATRR